MQYLKEKTNTEKKQILCGEKRMSSSYFTHIYIPSCGCQFLPHSICCKWHFSGPS